MTEPSFLIPSWTKTPKLWVDGSLVVANDVSIPRECFPKISECLKINWSGAARNVFIKGNHGFYNAEKAENLVINFLTRKIKLYGFKTYQKKQNSNILGSMFSFLFGFGQYFGRNIGFEIFKITMGSTVIVKISNHEYLPKYWPNRKKLRIIPPKMLLFCFFWYVLVPYWFILLVKKSISKLSAFVKSMISLYKLNTRGAGPISFYKLWNFGKTFSWYRHRNCNYEWPTNSQFASFSPDPVFVWLWGKHAEQTYEERLHQRTHRQ